MTVVGNYLRLTIVAVFLLTLEASWIGQKDCEPNTTYVAVASGIDCFALVDIDDGPISFTEASNKCAARFKNGHLVFVRIRMFLGDLTKWAVDNGLPNDTEAGYWTEFKRERPAPLEPNGTLSQANEDIRKDRDQFKLPSGISSSRFMPNDLWRNETQPGNALDERDEQCTAQSRPGKQPQYLGLDDYECNGAQLHYALCQVPIDRD